MMASIWESLCGVANIYMFGWTIGFVFSLGYFRRRDGEFVYWILLVCWPYCLGAAMDHRQVDLEEKLEELLEKTS